MKQQPIVKQPEQILTEVEKYLSGTTHEVTPNICGGCVYLNLKYDDFKPRREVRNTIEDIASNCIVESIERGYSDKYLVESLYAVGENEELYIKLPNGNMQSVGVFNLLEKYLQYRSFDRNISSHQASLEHEE